MNWINKKIKLQKHCLEVIQHFENQFIFFKSSKIITESFFGRNVDLERIFSLLNAYWSPQKSTLTVNTLSDIMKLKTKN